MWLPDDLRPVLRSAASMDDAQRYAALVGVTTRQGFRIETFIDARYYGGQAVPWRIVRLHEPPRLSLRDRLPRFLHEVVHVLRMKTMFPRLGGLSPWAWGAAYLLNPWFRRREEMLGEAYEAALKSTLVESSNTAHAVRHHVSTRLGGWFRFPYFAGGCKAEIEQQIAEMAVEVRRQVQ